MAPVNPPSRSFGGPIAVHCAFAPPGGIFYHGMRTVAPLPGARRTRPGFAKDQGAPYRHPRACGLIGALNAGVVAAPGAPAIP